MSAINRTQASLTSTVVLGPTSALSRRKGRDVVPEQHAGRVLVAHRQRDCRDPVRPDHEVLRVRSDPHPDHAAHPVPHDLVDDARAHRGYHSTEVFAQNGSVRSHDTERQGAPSPSPHGLLHDSGAGPR